SRLQLHLEDRPKSLVTIRLTDDWLLFEACRPEDDKIARASLWQLLRWNAELPGSAKFVLTGSQPFLQLRAEVPLDKRLDLAATVLQVGAGFRRAWTRIDGCFEGEALNESAACTQPAADLTDLCQEAGWSFTESTGGRLNIELEIQNAFHQAILEQ